MTGILLIQARTDPPKTLPIELAGSEGFILGRLDKKSSYSPDVDLSELNAMDKGVSRRHAALVYYEGKLHIVDLSSVNGTLLNGQRLMAETPYMLNAGDHLTLGQLPLTLLYTEK